MHVASIHLYPVKGCYRTTVERAVVEPWGLAGDRRWLIVRADTGEALTQRDLPAMTQLRPQLGEGGLLLTPDLPVRFPFAGELVSVRVWSSDVAARRACSADSSLSSMLGLPVWLVWLDDPTRRCVDPLFGGPQDRVSFADGYPLLLANTASLEALNVTNNVIQGIYTSTGLAYMNSILQTPDNTPPTSPVLSLGTVQPASVSFT